MGISNYERIMHVMCDPLETTELGEGPCYAKFISYVRTFIAPYMEMDFEEEDYYRDVHNEVWGYQHLVEQLPRGHSKTELVGLWETIYMADYQPYNPFYELYKGKKKRITEQLLLAGGGKDLEVWALRLKDFFYKSPILARHLPAGAGKDSTSKRWNDSEMMLNNGTIIHLRSMKSKIRGLHPDRLHADDLITENSSLTDKQTIAIWDGAVDGTTTTKEAMVQVTGTPLRFTDIQFHLKNKPESYYFKARPAILDWEKQTVLSPKRRNFEHLMRIKTRVGSVKFSTEYMLNPIDDSVSLIKRQYIMSCFDKYLEGLWLKPNINAIGSDVGITLEKLNNVNFRRQDWESIYITADFAFSDRITANKSVFSYYGKKTGRLYRLGYIQGQGWSPNTQFAILKALYDYLGGTMLGLEENSIKGVIKDARSMNMPVKLFWMGDQDKAPSFKPEVNFSDKRYIIGKVSAIERLGASYENRAFVIPYKTERDIEAAELELEEATSWALEEGKLVEIGRHPDIPICSILVNELMQTGGAAFDFSIRYVGSSAPENNKKREIVQVKGIEGEGS